MLIHGPLVERVDLRRLGGAAGGNYILGDSFDGRQMWTGEKQLGALARKSTCNSATDSTSGSIDHGDVVFEHHLWFPCPVPSKMLTPGGRETGRALPPPGLRFGR